MHFLRIFQQMIVASRLGNGHPKGTNYLTTDSVAFIINKPNL